MKRNDMVSFMVSAPLTTRDQQQWTIEGIECPRCHERRTINFQANTKVVAFRLALQIDRIELCGDCERKIDGLAPIERRPYDDSLRVKVNSMRQITDKTIMVQDGQIERRITKVEQEKFLADVRHAKWESKLGDSKPEKIPHWQLCSCLECVPMERYDAIVEHIPDKDWEFALKRIGR